jgi:hypothetical protein
MLKKLFYFYTLKVSLVKEGAEKGVKQLELKRHRKSLRGGSEVVDVMTLRGSFVKHPTGNYFNPLNGGFVFSTTGKPFDGVKEVSPFKYERNDFQVLIGGNVYLAESPKSLEAYE